jgi:hypothetical protein
MNDIEEQRQALEDVKAPHKAKALEADAPTLSLVELQASFANETGRMTTSPLDVEGIDLGVSADDILQFIAESRRYL